mmetsp:Transcript_15982/g.44196  ORF Transcript_15982/g.44196 Transcript_15982/m.44196 type:complete len:133 (-) Transcript_15982:2958-3356(-)
MYVRNNANSNELNFYRLLYRRVYERLSRSLFPNSDGLVTSLTGIIVRETKLADLSVVEPASTTFCSFCLCNSYNAPTQGIGGGDVLLITRFSNLFGTVHDMNLGKHKGCSKLVNSVGLHRWGNKTFVTNKTF